MTVTVKVEGLNPAVSFEAPDDDLAVRMACTVAVGMKKFPTTAWVWDGKHLDMKDGEGAGYRVELRGFMPDFGVTPLT